MVVYSTTHSDIIYNSNEEILYVNWKQRPSNNAFIETYLRGLEFVQEQVPVNLYCTDLSQLGPLEREQEAWLNNVFYSKLYDVLKTDIYVGVVFSDNHFKAIVTNYTATEATAHHHYVHFNYFTDREEAIFWLESVKKGRDNILLPTQMLTKSTS